MYRCLASSRGALDLLIGVSRSLTACLTISLALHAFVLLLAFTGAPFSWPRAPIEIELRAPPPKKIAPPRPKQPAQKKTPPAKAPSAPAKTEVATIPATLPAPPPELPASLPSAPDDDAVDEANIVFCLRVEALAHSPHREAIERLFPLMPDYRSLIMGSGTRLEEFVALLVATSDPRDLTRTFIAARFVDSPRVRAIADRPLGNGDPRQFRFPKPGLAILARPEIAAEIDAALASAEEPPDPADPRRRWLTQLAALERVDTEDGPAITLSAADIGALLRVGNGLPTPLSGAMAMTLEGAPALRARVTFADEESAQQIETEWPRLLERSRSMLALLGLSRALDDLRLTRHESEIELEGRIPERETRMALEWAKLLVPPDDASAARPSEARVEPPPPPPSSSARRERPASNQSTH